VSAGIRNRKSKSAGLNEVVDVNEIPSLAEYEIAKAKCVVPISNSPQKVPFLGEPLGCAMNVFLRAQIRAEKDVQSTTITRTQSKMEIDYAKRSKP
jgi:hypothetical protein